MLQARRRTSEIALPKVLGGSGAATLHPSASMVRTRLPPLHCMYCCQAEHMSIYCFHYDMLWILDVCCSYIKCYIFYLLLMFTFFQFIRYFVIFVFVLVSFVL